VTRVLAPGGASPGAPASLRSRARQGAARLLRFAPALRVTGWARCGSEAEIDAKRSFASLAAKKHGLKSPTNDDQPHGRSAAWPPFCPNPVQLKHNISSTPAVIAFKDQLATRERQVGPFRVTERLVVPVKSGNADGGKGPQLKGNDRSGKE